MNTKWQQCVPAFYLLLNSLTGAADNVPDLCDANNGLYLLNQVNPPLTQIKEILIACDKKIPQDVQVLLLHGLLARKAHQYDTAIIWLEKATAVAAADNNIPALELAVTYEWANHSDKALALYKKILQRTPDSRPAILGMARTETATNNLENALTIYKELLQKNPQDIDALNGMGRVLMAHKEFAGAAKYFNQVLSIQANNSDAQTGLQQVTQIAQQQISTDSKITPIITCNPNEGLKGVNQKPPLLLLVQQILLQCDQDKNTDLQVLLLHGLYERAQKKYPQAIEWLEKAQALETANNPVPELELAVTYEWSQQFLNAEAIYNKLLLRMPYLRPAVLGKARVALWQKNINEAQKIYNELLKKNAHDVDALNGLGRVKLVEADYPTAKKYFTEALYLEPHNTDAQIGIQQANSAKKIEVVTVNMPIKNQPSPCDTVRGLSLVNQKKPQLDKIHSILNYCDRLKPNDSNVLLLHGLLARTQKDYPTAILWFQKAKSAAPDNDPIPAQELALTYEWSLQLEKAQEIYDELLVQNPQLRPALLGKARVDTAEYHIHDANLIYKNLLATNPHDIDALNGVGRMKMTDKQFKEARSYFNEALELEPNNTDSLSGLKQLNNSTRYMASFNQGQYRILGQHANTSVLYAYADISATDRVIAIATHNSKQLQLTLPTDPGALPNNSFFSAFQRQIPGKYGFGINTEFREHKNLPLETRVGGTGNLYLLSNVQLFGGFWNGFAPPWNNQLYYSGLTYFTKLPFNVTVTGFWAHQQIGGKTETYSFDLSKEFSNSLFYSIGTSYTVTQKYWGYHGRFILPTFKNQALEGTVEHYDFNGITVFGLGWRVYWA